MHHIVKKITFTFAPQRSENNLYLCTTESALQPDYPVPAHPGISREINEKIASIRTDWVFKMNRTVDYIQKFIILHLIFFTKFFPLQILNLPLAHIRALSSNQLIFRVKTTCYIPICWGGHALFFFSSCSMYSYSCFLHFCWFDKAICPFLFPFCQEFLNILSVKYPSHFKDTPHAPGI